MTARRNQSPRRTPVIPTVNYDDAIRRRAEEITANNARPDDSTERVADRLKERIASQSEKLEAWQTLGNHYADVLANPKTPAALCNVINVELDELAARAGLNIASPEVLRLLYPMLRDHAEKREADRR